MSFAIIGYGSIGKRHAQILKELNQPVSIVTSQKNISEFPSYSDIGNCLKTNIKNIFICNKTSDHHDSLKKLLDLDFKGSIFVEKPLFHKHLLLQYSTENIYVLYNFRFHPALHLLKEKLQGKKIIHAQSYVGQYLPSWRPEQDYKKSYSANKSHGGGVLLDLSHEIDFLSLLLGSFQKVYATGGKLSSLDINSEDCYSILAKSPKCPSISLHMNYLDKIAQRHLTVITDQETYKIDFIKNEFNEDGKVTNLNTERNISYRNQIQAIINGLFSEFCTYNEGLQTLKVIEAIELSNQNTHWTNI